MQRNPHKTAVRHDVVCSFHDAGQSDAAAPAPHATAHAGATAPATTVETARAGADPPGAQHPGPGPAGAEYAESLLDGLAGIAFRGPAGTACPDARELVGVRPFHIAFREWEPAPWHGTDSDMNPDKKQRLNESDRVDRGDRPSL